LFPLSFLPSVGENGRVPLILGVCLLAGAEIAVITAVNFKLVVAPMRSMLESSKKLTKGEYVQVDFKTADNDIKTLALSLNNTAYEFENLEQMRKSFVSNASHELRSPLTSMQGFLQAILDGTIGDEDREKYLKIVLRETKRLSSLINSMLDLSRMESGKYPLNLSRFEINSVIKQIVERFEPNLIKKEVQLDVDFVRDTNYVYADKDKIIQVLINLIDNAIKYSPAYSRILVTTHIHGKKIYITVKDKGFGISKKDQMLIWDRFYMADKARTPTKSKGTGLGLSIVKKIIDDHKEVIWVESNKGAGATFIFTLTLFDPNKHKLEGGKVLQALNP
jgi:signal transduction histidine kinase